MLFVAFWGGSWCRKCTALKPAFVKTAAVLSEQFEGRIQCIYCGAKAIAKASDMPPSIALEKLAGVKTVPTFQCWRNGQVVGEMVSACDRSSLLASLSEMVQRLA